MSPPKVNLGSKVPEEKQGQVEFPAVVTVETERRAHHHRGRHQHRRRNVICGVAMTIIVVAAVAATFLIVHKIRHHHRKDWDCKVGKGHLPEHIHADHDKQIIHARHESDKENNLPKMHTLHDYKHKLVAYKNEDTNVCYIDRLDMTYEEGYAKWEAQETTVRRGDQPLHVLTGRKIEAVVLEHVATEHIYMHCKNAKSFWVMEITKTEITKEMEIVYV